MKNVKTKTPWAIAGGFIAALLLMFVLTGTNTELAAAAHASSEIVELADLSADFDSKCGDDKAKEGETKEKKEKKSDKSVKESKCGEGKCGDDKAKAKEGDKAKEGEKESKCGEGKCGEGKCG